MTATPRQYEVAELVAKGLKNKQIARELGISPETVNTHIRDIAAKIAGPGAAKFKCLVWFLTEKEKRRAA